MEEDKIITQRKNRKRGKIALITLGILSLVVGTAIGIILVKKNQEIREKAATPTGTVRVFLSPETKTIKKDENFDVNILIDTAGNYISALTINLTYQYSSPEPPIKAENIQINSNLLVNGGWNFPIKTYDASDGLAEIRIGGLNSSTTGYKTSGEEILATITFKGYNPGSITLVFEPTTTKATNKTTGEDILLTPSSTGNYKVESSQPTETPTTPTPSNKTPVNTTEPEKTTTPFPTSQTQINIKTPTPSPLPQPESGVSTPTFLGITTGILLILISFFSIVF